MAAAKANLPLELLSRAHSPDTASKLFTERVKQRPLHIKPTEPSPSDNGRQRRRTERLRRLERRKRAQKPKPLSAREKRALCIHEIPRVAATTTTSAAAAAAAQRRYAVFEQLHRMWVSYIQEVLGDTRQPVSGGAAAKLVSADYHGAEVEVVRSRCVSRVGVRGIIVKDTRFTFEVVTRASGVKTLPKEHTVFRFEVPRRAGGDGDGDGGSGDGERKPEEAGAEEADKFVFELHGEQFQHRATDRANKKFKSHYLPDL